VASDQERFGERLRRHREAAGYSQEDLAERAGLSANAISALERGDRKRPYPDTLRRLADALGLSATERSDLAASARRHPPEASSRPEQLSPSPSPALPGELTPLIGREREAEVIQHLLSHLEGRLLTLTGSGGVGKTRLALHVARAASDAYRDGVVWVELAPVGEEALVIPAIARAMGLEEVPGGDHGAALRTYLRDRQALLVIDNFEHVLGAAMDLAALLRGCPGVSILATSRAPLHIRGEQEYVVPPLELPPAGHPTARSDVANVPAVQLFVWQVRQRDPSFALCDENAAEVAAICRRLDGVPLALELAAARVKLLGTPELLARLDRALPLLTGGARDLPARQRTMEGTIRWSYDLLSPAEQALFRRLSVFSGGWTLEAAEAVASVPQPIALDMLEGMAGLIDRSLARQMPGGDRPPRFTMLEVLREFGRERLADTAELDAVRQAHLDWCVALAESGETGLAGPEQAAWLERLEAEHDNLRAALGSTAASSAEFRVRLAGALWRFWWWHGHFTEGRAWLDQVLATGAEVAAAWRSRALLAAGILAREQGDFDPAIALFDESLAIRRSLGDRRGTAQALNNLGLVAINQGLFDVATERFEEALALYRASADQLGIANVLNNIGIVAREEGDFTRARELYTETLGLLRALGERRGLASTLHNLGRVSRDQGDLARAETLYRESLDIEHRLAGERENEQLVAPASMTVKV
jgi:predicted ATPase/DNA-binding XRE family transcriptional regulator